MKESDAPEGRGKEMAVETMDLIYVEIVGAKLVSQAVEELLKNQPGFYVKSDDSTQLPGPQIVLIVGQDGFDVLKRRQRRSARQRREGFALITNGVGIDFRLARDLPIRVFIGTNDSIPLFLQGLRAAATGCNFCSPQVVPFLLAATSVPIGSAPEMSGSLSAAAIAPPLRTAHETTKPPESRTAAPESGRIHALSDEMRRALQRGLSDREAEIALQAARGLSNQQIADAFDVTLSTVKFHLYRVYRKLGIKRRSQLSQLTSP